jgi:hypothetical protein
VVLYELWGDDRHEVPSLWGRLLWGLFAWRWGKNEDPHDMRALWQGEVNCLMQEAVTSSPSTPLQVLKFAFCLLMHDSFLQKPRTKPNSQRDNWHGAPQPYEATAGTKHRVSGFEAKNGVTMKADDVHFVSSLRPSHNSYHAGASTDSRRSSATGSVSDYSSYSGSRRGSTNSNSSGRAKNDVLSRLTDASKYPGHHKHRFDEDGQGLGAMGRDRVTKGAGHIPSGLRL